MPVGSVEANHFSKIGGVASPSTTTLSLSGSAAETTRSTPTDSSASSNRASLRSESYGARSLRPNELRPWRRRLTLRCVPIRQFEKFDGGHLTRAVLSNDLVEPGQPWLV